MGIAKKGRHKFNHDGVEYLWWVAVDVEFYSRGSCLHAQIVRCDKKLLLSFQLDQPADTCHLTIKRDTRSGPWRRLRCPVFQAKPQFTPGTVRELLDWFRDYSENAEEVNYRGDSIG
ncbi:MAG: hypothetical protein KDA69_15510 [Planctomycetaceae bacterium]|nr:hypothetical protein [Planctomycetaceae bacterium]